MNLCARWSILPHCCGIVEAGDFGNVDNCDVSADTPAELVQYLIDDVEGRPIMFNFVRERLGNDWKFIGDPLTLPIAEEYDYEELREYISNHEDSQHIGEFINPNSDNLVDSWVLLSNLTKPE